MDAHFAHPLLRQFWQMNNRVFLLGSAPGEDILASLLSEGTRRLLKADLVQTVLRQGFRDDTRGPGIITVHVLRFDAIPLTFDVPARQVPDIFGPLRDRPGTAYQRLYFDAEMLESTYADLWAGLKRRYRDDQVDGIRMGIFSHFHFDVATGQVPTVLCLEHGAVVRSIIRRPPAS